jgi:hypothetical protein
LHCYAATDPERSTLFVSTKIDPYTVDTRESSHDRGLGTETTLQLAEKPQTTTISLAANENRQQKQIAVLGEWRPGQNFDLQMYI